MGLNAEAGVADPRQIAGFFATFFNLCNVTLGAGILSYPVRLCRSRSPARPCLLRLISLSLTPRQQALVLSAARTISELELPLTFPLPLTLHVDLAVRVRPGRMVRLGALHVPDQRDFVRWEPRTGALRGAHGGRDRGGGGGLHGRPVV